MKINKAITEALINYIHLVFEKSDPDLGEFKVLLISSGISKSAAPEFFSNKCKDKINYQRLEEEIAAGHQFFLDLSSNLFPYLDKSQRELFGKIMRRFGYKYADNRFKKGKKNELQGYSNARAIKKIEIYKDEDRHRFRIALNDRLIPWVSPHGNTDKHYWDYIYEIAKDGESEIIDAGKANGIEQWFNSKKENPIYKKSGLELTKIIERKSEFLYPVPGIKFKLLTQKKAYS